MWLTFWKFVVCYVPQLLSWDGAMRANLFVEWLDEKLKGWRFVIVWVVGNLRSWSNDREVGVSWLWWVEVVSLLYEKRATKYMRCRKENWWKCLVFRLSHTFRLVQNFHWIVVEDGDTMSALVANLLKASMLNYTHLAAPTPSSWKRKLMVSMNNKRFKISPWWLTLMFLGMILLSGQRAVLWTAAIIGQENAISNEKKRTMIMPLVVTGSVCW